VRDAESENTALKHCQLGLRRIEMPYTHKSTS
jgi:hypothetical protein